MSTTSSSAPRGAEVVESLGRGHGVDNLADPAGDVVADEAHAVDSLTAAFGGFVGVPDLDRGAVDGLHLGVAAQAR